MPDEQQASQNYKARNYGDIDKAIHDAIEQNQIIVLTVEMLIGQERKRDANSTEAMVKAKYQPIIDSAMKSCNLLKQIKALVKGI